MGHATASRTFAHTSKPSPSGRFTSSRMTSGPRLHASTADAASPATSVR